MSWRLTPLLDEVWRNLRLPNVALVLGAAALLALVGIVEHADVRTILDRERALEEAGLHVYVAESSAGGVDARRCALLPRTTGVQAAGSVTPRATALTVATDPARELPVLAVTRGLVRIWDRNHSGRLAAFGVTTPVADDLGLEAGSHVLPLDAPDRAVAAGPARVDFVADTSVRAAHVAAAALVIVPATGTASQCWVEFDPRARVSAVQILRAALGGPDADLSVRPLAVRDEALVPPLPQALRTRASRTAWAASGVALGLAAAVVAWGRRHDLAVYRALGMGRLTAVTYQAVETLVVVTASTSLAIALIGVATDGALADGSLPSRLALWSVLRGAAVWWAVTLLAGLPFSLPDRMLATLKGA